MSFSTSPLFEVPSLERPFGIQLWPLFDKYATLLTNGAFKPSEFQFVQGELPLSTLYPVLGLISLYYVVIFGGRSLIRALGIKPLVLNGLFQLHNLFLTSLSSLLLVLMVEQLVPMILKEGLFYAICDKGAWTQQMVCLYYMNYITKFIEFIDTVFLVVKQKKLTFLHTYHHGATLLLCFTQLTGTTPISWVPISLNLGVHVVMYFYYFLAARGIRVWWKEWVTRFQIIQFVLDLGFVYFLTYQKIAFTFFPETLPFCGDCAGKMQAAVYGCSILSSYLVLFIAFYIEVYRKSGKKAKHVKSIRGGFSAKVNEYVNLEKAKLVSATPSPAPSKTRRRRKN